MRKALRRGKTKQRWMTAIEPRKIISPVKYIFKNLRPNHKCSLVWSKCPWIAAKQLPKQLHKKPNTDIEELTVGGVRFWKPYPKMPRNALKLRGGKVCSARRVPTIHLLTSGLLASGLLTSGLLASGLLTSGLLSGMLASGFNKRFANKRNKRFAKKK